MKIPPYTNEASWCWCEPTCQYYELQAGLGIRHLWHWPMWPFLRYELTSGLNFDKIQTEWQTVRQKVLHMSPPCKMHRWAQKLGLLGTTPLLILRMSTGPAKPAFGHLVGISLLSVMGSHHMLEKCLVGYCILVFFSIRPFKINCLSQKNSKRCELGDEKKTYTLNTQKKHTRWIHKAIFFISMVRKKFCWCFCSSQASC